MRLSTLTQAGALTGGADSWFMPEPSKSSWARRIDWYISFQMARSQAHQSKKFSPELTQLMEQWDVPYPQHLAQGISSPLLISSENFIPSQMLIMVPLNKEVSEWFKEIINLRHRLKNISIRVFLPRELTSSSAMDLWPHCEHEGDVTFVADPLSH